MNICSIEGCDRPVAWRGWCRIHYGRWWRHGDPTYIRPDTTEKRLWSRTDRAGPIPDHKPELGQCWVWQGSVNRWGYGQIETKGKNRRTHIVAYELLKGPVPAGLQIDHLCRNPGCVNPEHMEPVTPKENSLRGQSPTILIHLSNKCSRGHEFTPENIYMWRGYRQCRECRRMNRKGMV